MASDVNILNVEPGAYGFSARLISGWFGSLKYLSASPFTKSLGSKLGFEASATTEPSRAFEHDDRAGVRRVVAAAVRVDQRPGTVHALRQRVLGDLLDAEVDGEPHVVAGDRLLHLHHVHRPALVVDLDLLEPGRAAQLGLEHLLDAVLPIDVAGLVAVALVGGELLRR